MSERLNAIERAGRGPNLQEMANDAQKLTKEHGIRFANKVKETVGGLGLKDIMEAAQASAEAKVNAIQNAVKTLLNIPSGTLITGTEEYEATKAKVEAIYNNTKLGLPENLMDYTVVTVSESVNTKMVTLSTPTEPISKVQVMFNKLENRFNVSKDGLPITSRAYI